MKRAVLVGAFLAQLVAAVSYIVIAHAIVRWNNRGISNATFFLTIFTAAVMQSLAVYLKKKYPKESERVEETLYVHKKKYRVIALVVFLAVVVGFLVYIYLVSRGKA